MNSYTDCKKNSFLVGGKAVKDSNGIIFGSKCEDILKLFIKIFENNTEGVLIADREGETLWINGAFTEITEYEAKEIIGKNYWIFNKIEEDKDIYKKIKNSLFENGKWKGEVLEKRKNGEKYPQSCNLFVIKDEQKNITHFAAIIRDITEYKSKEEKINYLAFRDFLTGVYNRAFFIGRLNYTLVNVRRKKENIGILFIDLDGFKNINDNLGHAIGDKLLQRVAKRIKLCVSEEDIVARIGGDEFIVLLSKMDGVENAIKIAQSMIDFFEQPFIVSENKLYVDISIGIAIYPNDGENADELMINADIAMYKAKETKGNKFERFSHELNEKVKEKFKLENLLKDALMRNEFLLYYQPIINIKTGKMIGAESLIRWKTQKLGIVSPDKFIPITESNGLIIPIGEWVLKTACIQNKKWQDAGYIPIYLSVNISIKQIEQKDFINIVKNILMETGLNPKYLELEITESISAENVPNIINTFEKLKYLGVKLSIDDFGTGYSSLGQLKRLPISKLKIDKSFIEDIPENMNNKAVASAIIAMAKRLNFEVVAEGIENDRQLKFLKENNCDMGQGYLFSRPIDADSFEIFLKNKTL